MKFAVILPFAVGALAGVARRQADQLPAAILAIATATNGTNDAVLAFNGDGTALASASNNVLASINNADTIAQASAQLTLDQLIALIDPTNQLNAAVNTTIDNTIAARQALVDACLGPTVLASLLAQQSASTQLTNDLAAKAPDGFADAVRQSSGVAAASLQQGIDAFADAPGCTSTTTTAAQETTTTAETSVTVSDGTTTVVTVDPTNTDEPPVYPTEYPTAPYYPTDAPYYPPSAPSTYPIKPTEYETYYTTYCPLTSTDKEGHESTSYGYSTVVVTIYPTEHPAPTYVAKTTEYATTYVTYVPETTTVIVDNKPQPTTYAVVKTVTVTIAPVPKKTACPSKSVVTYVQAPPLTSAAPPAASPAGPAKPAGNNPVQQIGDGQVQSPAKPAGNNGNAVQQIGDGQIQSPAKPSNGTASPSKPEVYTGAASKAQAVGLGVFAVMVAAVAL